MLPCTHQAFLEEGSARGLVCTQHGSHPDKHLISVQVGRPLQSGGLQSLVRAWAGPVSPAPRLHAALGDLDRFIL